ncbi:conserved hypothetical protein [Alteracholeplasma palmae J233]|uniref:Uncharacterized protein n=1 Tax=Alteracholeplasma palmae (strain ATCC 49389 / J233) TaxID=1318466 RepID=U4KRC7_ALTPJ|nr:hypothetical protein [Alteracholeplasma palmae]CCV64046.1 conserved hypothetical protein [Alteracholeplasma palmae J233]
MLFFKILGLEVNIGILITFFVGIAMGMVIMVLLYLLAVLKGISKGLKLRNTDEQDIDEEEIKWLIKDCQTEFQNKKNRDLEGFGAMLTRLDKQLARDIATKFYPKSKYPFLELSIDETLVLVTYIKERVEQLFESRILRLFRGMTLRRIMELKNTKEVVENNAIVKTTKKYSKISSIFFASLNAVNPVYWIRKVFLDKVLETILVKIGLAVIGITGEETYKIYSKKVFKEERNLDSDLQSIYDDLNKTVTEAMNEEKRSKK